jgi:hypothetical protein
MPLNHSTTATRAIDAECRLGMRLTPVAGSELTNDIIALRRVLGRAQLAAFNHNLTALLDAHDRMALVHTAADDTRRIADGLAQWLRRLADIYQDGGEA